MELTIILVSLCLCLLPSLLLLLLLLLSKSTKNLPPGPSKIGFLATFILLRKSYFEFGPLISNLRQKYGPLITVHLGFQPTIFITNSSLAHQALVLNGAVFAGRPSFIHNVTTSYQRPIISNSPYGPTWRALRRNLAGGVLNPSQLKFFSLARKRVLDNLISALENDSKENKPMIFTHHFRYAIFCLLAQLCFGDNIDDDHMKIFEKAQKQSALAYQKMKIFFIMPKISKFLFRRKWAQLSYAMTHCNNIFLSIIRSRKKENESRNKDEQSCVSYLDTLLNFQLPGEEEKLEENHIMWLCKEFINAGADSTTTAFEWIMANIVKYPHVQAKIFVEMRDALGQEKEWVQEEDIEKIPYLKAVILEGLRRHPPGYSPLTPRAVTEDVELGGYTIPKGTAVNFLIQDVGRDPKIWEEPMEFKPERFLKNDKSNNATDEEIIRMMPFGAGRRICPGNGMAMLNLNYLVANLVWKFKWWLPEGQDVDLTEKFGVSVSMKFPLKACISPRFSNIH